MSSQHNKNEPFLVSLIKKRTFALTIAVVLSIVLAVIGWLKIPIEVMPRENISPFLFLRVNASESLSAEKTELLLTLPVEGAIRTLPNLAGYSTNTSSNGISVSLTFKPRTNLEMAILNLQESLQDLENRGILDRKNISISRFNPEASAVIKISITEDRRKGSINDLVTLIKEDFRIGLESIPEISKVEFIGLEPLIYQYSLSTAQLTEQGIETGKFPSLVQAKNLREPLGEALLGQGSRVVGIHSRLVLKDLSELTHQTLLRGHPTHLAQLADEQVIDKSKDEFSRKNGEAVIFAEIFNKETANLFSLKKNLKNYLDSLSTDISDLKKLKFETILDKTDDLKNAIDDVFESLYQAMLITFVIVVLFLRKIKETLIIALTIPITLLLTVWFMHTRNMSLNVLTLSGLILSIGMVVDNAILVVERIQDYRHMKLSRKEAGARGAADVAMALLMSTLTNAVIFLPVAFIEGGDTFTDLLKAFQIPILGSLFASLFVALLFIPIVMIFTEKDNPSNSTAIRQQELPLKEEIGGSPAIIQVFRKIHQYKYPLTISSIIVVVWLGSQIMQINQTDIETPRDPYTTVSVKFSPETNEKQRREFFEKFEKDFLSEQKTIKFRFIVSEYNPQFLSGSVYVYPMPSTDLDTTLNNQDKKVKDYLYKRKNPAGMLLSVGYEYAASSTTHADIRKFTFSGPKMSRLLAVLDELKEELAKIQGIEKVSTDKEERGQKEMIFVPHEVVLSQYKLKLAQIAQEVSASMANLSFSSLNYNGKTVAAKITLKPPHGQWNMEALKELKITVDKNKFVNLLDLGHFTESIELKSISRQAGSAKAKIYVHFKEGLTKDAYSKATSKVYSTIDRFSFPLGYGIPKEESEKNVEEMQAKGNFIIYLSVLLIYLILASLFDSILIPFAILLTIPLAIIFGISGLYFLKMDLDVMARLSLVILVGIAVNNAIILIDLITGLQAQGFNQKDAIAMGCASRLKAVMMTTAIQVIGVLPVALGKSKIMGIPYASLGVSIISGMLFSTIVTLIILPMAYEALNTLELRLKKTLGFSA